MPPKYFAFIDGEQRGPYTLEQLGEAGIHPSTYVWCKGMDDWQRADKVEEIRNLFKHRITEHREKVETVRMPEPTVYTDNKPLETGEPEKIRFPLPEVETQEDLNRPPQVSMTLAVLSLLLCFPLTGFIAVFFTYRALKTWNEACRITDGRSAEQLKAKSHEYERLSKMWLGLTVAFGIIFWTLIFSIPKNQ